MNYFGKYRGKVENNLDPLQQGRLQVSCPAVLGDGTNSWAMPCVPYAGRKVGLFMLPERGANVWIEFEAGDLDYPIWSGCFWGPGEAPAIPAIPEMKVFKTDGISLTMNSTRGIGGISLEVGPPIRSQRLKLSFDAQGIALSCEPAQLKLTPTGVELQLTPATLKLSAGGVELGMGASSVKLSPVTVSINNGALEIT